MKVKRIQAEVNAVFKDWYLKLLDKSDKFLFNSEHHVVDRNQIFSKVCIQFQYEDGF
jgi:hypothetical protein